MSDDLLSEYFKEKEAALSKASGIIPSSYLLVDSYLARWLVGVARMNRQQVQREEQASGACTYYLQDGQRKFARIQVTAVRADHTLLEWTYMVRVADAQPALYLRIFYTWFSRTNDEDARMANIELVDDGRPLPIPILKSGIIPGKPPKPRHGDKIAIAAILNWYKSHDSKANYKEIALYCGVTKGTITRWYGMLKDMNSSE